MPFQWVACGRGFFGELGRPVKERSEKTFQNLGLLDLPQHVKSIECGQFHNICVDREGQAFSWGANFHGQLSLAKEHDKFTFSDLPRKVCLKTETSVSSTSEEVTESQKDISNSTEKDVVLEAKGGKTFSLFRTKDKLFIAGRIPRRYFGAEVTPAVESVREVEFDGHVEDIENISCGSGHALIHCNGEAHLLHHRGLNLPTDEAFHEKVADDWSTVHKTELPWFEECITFSDDDQVSSTGQGEGEVDGEQEEVDVSMDTESVEKVDVSEQEVESSPLAKSVTSESVKEVPAVISQEEQYKEAKKLGVIWRERNVVENGLNVAWERDTDCRRTDCTESVQEEFILTPKASEAGDDSPFLLRALTPDSPPPPPRFPSESPVRMSESAERIDVQVLQGEVSRSPTPMPDNEAVEEPERIPRAELPPVRFEGVSKIRFSLPVSCVACGYEHALFLLKKGAVFSWGNGNQGQLGHGDGQPRLRPTLVKGIGMDGESVVSITCGHMSSYATTDYDRVYAWGSNHNGQLALGHQYRGSRTPCRVRALSQKGVKVLAAGAGHAVALLNSGVVYSWGHGAYGQLGYDLDECLGSAKRNRWSKVPLQNNWIQFEPRRVPLKLKAEEVTCGAWYTYILLQGNFTVGPEDTSMTSKTGDFLVTARQYTFGKGLPEVFPASKKSGGGSRSASPSRRVSIKGHPEPFTELDIKKLFETEVVSEDEETVEISEKYKRRIHTWLVEHTGAPDPHEPTVINLDDTCESQPLSVPIKPERTHRFSQVIELAKLAGLAAKPYVPEVRRGTPPKRRPISPESSAIPSAECSLDASSSDTYPPGPYSKLVYDPLGLGNPRESARAGPTLKWDICDEAINLIFGGSDVGPDPEGPLRIDLFPEWAMMRQLALRPPRQDVEILKAKSVASIKFSSHDSGISRDVSLDDESLAPPAQQTTISPDRVKFHDKNNT